MLEIGLLRVVRVHFAAFSPDFRFIGQLVLGVHCQHGLPSDAFELDLVRPELIALQVSDHGFELVDFCESSIVLLTDIVLHIVLRSWLNLRLLFKRSKAAFYSCKTRFKPPEDLLNTSMRVLVIFVIAGIVKLGNINKHLQTQAHLSAHIILGLRVDCNYCAEVGVLSLAYGVDIPL